MNFPDSILRSLLQRRLRSHSTDFQSKARHDEIKDIILEDFLQRNNSTQFLILLLITNEAPTNHAFGKF